MLMCSHWTMLCGLLLARLAAEHARAPDAAARPDDSKFLQVRRSEAGATGRIRLPRGDAAGGLAAEARAASQPSASLDNDLWLSQQSVDYKAFTSAVQAQLEHGHANKASAQRKKRSAPPAPWATVAPRSGVSVARPRSAPTTSAQLTGAPWLGRLLWAAATAHRSRLVRRGRGPPAVEHRPPAFAFPLRR